MKEQFLHFVWKYHRFNHHQLQTIDGQSIKIIDYGWLNPHDGPDFLNAKISIDDVLWVGHVEIHIQTSDWDKHQHSKDEQYNNIILHVVYRHDKSIQDRSLPTLELNGLIPKSIYDKYVSLIESTTLLPCQHLISDLEPSLIQMYLHRLSVERMESKVSKIEALLQEHHHDFEQVTWIWLARYFGIGSNADAFQELATQVPIQWCYKLQHSPNTITALLLGKAGFLQHLKSDDTYLKNLISEYQYVQRKWNLHAMPAQWWKWKMGRPASFPTLKLAQLAELIKNHQSLFQLVLDIDHLSTSIEKIHLPEFWDEHYLLNKTSVHKEKSISQNFVHRIIINVSIPLMIAYGRWMDENIWIDKAFDLLQSLPAEHNKITKTMQQSGLQNEHALDSQALLHLKNEYCDLKNCLNCQIGNRIIQSSEYQVNEPIYQFENISLYI